MAFNSEQIKDIFHTLNQYGKTNQGMMRLAYGETDEAAHKYLIKILTDLDYDVRQDAMGNVFARLQGHDSSLSPIAFGSHIDTVPQGGEYDGVVGVIAGLFAMSHFAKHKLAHSLELIIFRAEESSRFGFSCMASKVMSNNANLTKWAENYDENGINFFTAIKNAGYNPQDLASCLLSSKDYAAFFEAHIEQGKVLESFSQKIGIVEAIAAPNRYRIDIKGNADHSGATPMSQRQDALVGAAHIISDLHSNANRESIYNTVATVGKLSVSPNSINVIPGFVQLYVDIRGINQDSINRVITKLYASIEKVQIDHELKIELVELSREKEVHLNQQMCDLLEDAVKKQNISYRRMISGAGHDAMYMAQLFPTAMLFIPSRAGISHNPLEYSDFADIIHAGEILVNTFRLFDEKYK